MTNFSSRLLPEEDLTIVTVHGQISTAEILAYAEKLHESKELTRLLLWDAMEVEVSGISSAEFREMGVKMKAIVQKRPDGKTAIVAGSDLNYGIGRMYSAYAELETNPVSYGIFRTIEEAIAWLKA